MLEGTISLYLVIMQFLFDACYAVLLIEGEFVQIPQRMLDALHRAALVAAQIDAIGTHQHAAGILGMGEGSRGQGEDSYKGEECGFHCGAPLGVGTHFTRDG